MKYLKYQKRSLGHSQEGFSKFPEIKVSRSERIPCFQNKNFQILKCHVIQNFQPYFYFCPFLSEIYYSLFYDKWKSENQALLSVLCVLQFSGNVSILWAIGKYSKAISIELNPFKFNLNYRS